MACRLWFLLLLILWTPGSEAKAAENSNRRLKILTSIAPLYSWAANVAGDRADVQNLLPPNVGPHDFQFRPRDLRKVREADVIFLNGLGMESWLTRVLTGNEASLQKRIVEVATGIPTNDLIHDLPQIQLQGDGDKNAHDHGHDPANTANPHVWLDPVFARHGVSNLLAVLQQVDPGNAAAYASNASAYLSRLLVLQDDLKMGIQRLPRRDIVTFHDAFPYFCRRFGIHLVGVIEEVPGASPSPRYLAELSKAIRENQVAALFVEPLVEIKLANQLARDLKIGVAVLDTLEASRLDTDSYENGMRANLRALQQALK